jgi:hypothetical protein
VNLSLTTSQNTAGAGTDTLSGLENLTGGSGADALTGTTTANTLSGGPGDDTVNSRDSVRDQVACDGGADLVTGDVQDGVATDCERFDDGVAPDTTIDSGPPALVNSPSAGFTFSSTDPNSTFQCKLDAATAWSSCSSPKSYTALPKGSHTFRVRATDEFGNLDATEATRTWTITLLPIASFTFSPTAPVAGDTVGFTSTSTVTGVGNTIVTHEWDFDGDGKFEVNTKNIGTTARLYASAGTFPVKLRVTDNDGNASTVSGSVTVSQPPPPPPVVLPPAPVILRDTKAPRLTLGGPTSQRLSRSGSVTVLASCNEPCSLIAWVETASGKLSGALQGSKARVGLAAGAQTKLRLKFSRKALKTIKRALAGRKRVSATVRIVGEDAAGNTTSVARKLKLKR